ncbi:MAG: histidine kinase [Clostridia bacterium]|nr:histidine kinase [Clostridia bacterium]
MKSFLIISIPAILVFMLLLMYIYKIQVDKIREQIQFDSDNTTIHRMVLTENIFDDFDSCVKNIENNPQLINFFSNQNPYENSTEFRKMVKSFRESADVSLLGSSLVSYVSVYSEKSGYVLNRYYKGNETELKNRIKVLKNNKAFRGYYTETIQNTKYLTMIRLIYDADNFVGAVVQGVFYDNLSEYLNLNMPNLLGITIKDDLGYMVLDTFISDNVGLRYITSETEADSGIKITCYTDVSEAMNIGRIFTVDLIIFIAAVFFILILFTAFASLKIYLPFKELFELQKSEDVMEKMEEYEKVIENDIKQRRTGSFFGVNFKELLNKLDKMQTVALQNQINPHFISNTLQIIGLQAEGLIGVDNKVSNMLMNLSQILKYAISTKSLFASVEEEMEYLKLYTNIQKERFRNVFELYIDIPDALMKIKVAKVTFQPIVENAIPFCRKAEGNIYISGRKKGKKVCFYIVNDGEPIAQQTADKLNKEFLSKKIPDGLHVGLNNVNQRLKLLFGNEYGIYISYDENGRTMIRITVPDEEL